MSERYSRQVMVPEFGPEAQERLRRATILVVGAGGLGCPVLSYLAGAGAGRLVLVDHDVVAGSNLHRQPLYRMADIGRLKAEAASDVLRAVNPDVAVDVRAEPLTPDNVDALVADADVIVDAADSFAVTYVLSDSCLAAGRPFVSASVAGLAGYAGIFCGGGPSYRAVFPDMPDRVASCAADGVLGTAVAMVGAVEAHIALQHAAGMATAPRATIFTLDARTLRFGSFSFAGAAEPESVVPFISQRLVRDDDLVVDLRGLDEAPVSPFPAALRLGVDEVDALKDDMPESRRIVLCCRTGLRAWRAARRLRQLGVPRLALVALQA